MWRSHNLTPHPGGVIALFRYTKVLILLKFNYTDNLDWKGCFFHPTVDFANNTLDYSFCDITQFILSQQTGVLVLDPDNQWSVTVNL